MQYNDWVAWFRAKHPDKVSLDLFLWHRESGGRRSAKLTSTLSILFSFVFQAEQDDSEDRKVNDKIKPKKISERYDLYKKRFLSRQVRQPSLASSPCSELSFASHTSADPLSFSSSFCSSTVSSSTTSPRNGSLRSTRRSRSS